MPGSGKSSVLKCLGERFNDLRVMTTLRSPNYDSILGKMYHQLNENSLHGAKVLLCDLTAQVYMRQLVGTTWEKPIQMVEGSLDDVAASIGPMDRNGYLDGAMGDQIWNLVKTLPRHQPDIKVLLYCSPDTAKARLQARGYPGDQLATTKFLEDLQNNIKDYNRPDIVIKTDHAGPKEVAEIVCRRVREKIIDLSILGYLRGQQGFVPHPLFAAAPPPPPPPPSAQEGEEQEEKGEKEKDQEEEEEKRTMVPIDLSAKESDVEMDADQEQESLSQGFPVYL